MADLKYSCRVLGRIYMFRSSVENAHAISASSETGNGRYSVVGWPEETVRETVIGWIFYISGNIEGVFFFSIQLVFGLDVRRIMFMAGKHV